MGNGDQRYEDWNRFFDDMRNTAAGLAGELKDLGREENAETARALADGLKLLKQLFESQVGEGAGGDIIEFPRPGPRRLPYASAALCESDIRMS